ncbi:MAG TPA: amidohydrolase [Thermomicrobiales bacterium]|jgi:amidohydrolase|nr:amidohydrolase [Thermomicrobiales bacterium]
MTAAPPDFHAAVDEILPGMVADRRHLHEHPELGFQEYETARFVAGRLAQLGLEDIQTGIAQTGVTGLIRGTATDGPGAGRCVLLRADMDALPITEETDVPFASQNPGVMHACGHDAHTTILLGVARLLMERRATFSGTVKVLFQPCEEQPPGGAKPMVEAGVLENPTVDAAFALHVAPDAPTGTIKVLAGPVSAASDTFFVDIAGHGGHGAYPHRTVDPVAIGARIVSALQPLVAREIDPQHRAVVTVGSLVAGEADNVVPDTARMKGTVRTYDEADRELLRRRIPEVIRGVAAAMGATVTMDYVPGYPGVVNDEAMTELVRRAAIEVVGEDNVRDGRPMMGVEDFAYFAQRVPACFYNLGVKFPDRDAAGVHHPKFDMNEDALAVGAEVMVTVVDHWFRAG